MYGEKYNIESDVSMVAYELANQDFNLMDIRATMNVIYKKAINAIIKMLKEGDSILYIP